jgi:hypothetical protein
MVGKELIAGAFPGVETPVAFCPEAPRICEMSGIRSRNKKDYCRNTVSDQHACVVRRPEYLFILAEADDSIGRLLDLAGPSAIVRLLNCNSARRNPTAYFSRLTDDVRRHCAEFRDEILPVLHREKFEVSPRMSPIYLPVVNFFGFHSEEFSDLYTNFSAARVESLRKRYYEATYRSSRNKKPGAFTKQNIVYQKDSSKHKFFVGAATADIVHYKALLRAFFRFGVPLDEGFHYDVHNRSGSLDGHKFWDARNGEWIFPHGMYVNITPDDSIRVP